MAKTLGLDDPVFSKGSHTLFDDTDYDVSKLQPKVKIPKFIGDYLSRCKKSGDRISDVMDIKYMADEMPDEVNRWLYETWTGSKERQELFARAWLDGYEIEKETRYILPMDGTKPSSEVYKLYAHRVGKRWDVSTYYPNDFEPITVTQQQLDNAPAWVKAIKPVKVNE